MLAFIAWYFSILVIGWLAFPLAFRLLPNLPERGYVLAKALGLLLAGFIFWLLASLHVIQNDSGGVLVSLLILAALSFLAGRGRWTDILAWVREHRRVVVTSEILFLGAFALWTVFRAAYPEAKGTEKEMELAFINAILRSEQFPPHDPWLSGYAISYYYFGYVIVAFLSRLCGLPGEIGFNLGVASWFGLAAVGAYGVLYDLLEGGYLSKKEPDEPPRRKKSATLALLAPLFILLIGNFGGLLEVLHAGGVFWERNELGEMNSSVWRWLDVQELTDPPGEPYDFVPKRNGGTWWWRSSRILTDYNLNGTPIEVIDEFPAFSFVLGDLHPHVLAMPFTLLAVGLALQLYLKTRGQAGGSVQASGWVGRADFWLGALVLGGMAFLNTWSFPIYVALYVGGFLIARIQAAGWSGRRLTEALILGALTGVAGLLLYLPFYVGFSSQAGGIIPSLSFFTRGAHFWLMFGTLLLPILFWLVHKLPAGARWKTFTRGLGIATVIVFGLWLASYLLGAAAFAIPQAAAALIGLQGGVEPGMVLGSSLAKRLAQPGMWLSMLAILGLVIGLLWKTIFAPADDAVEQAEPQPNAAVSLDGFLLLMVLTGGLLVLGPEYFYLRDQFGWRMNTIFKFYFEAWVLWGLLAAYASAWLWREYRAKLRWLAQGAWVVLVACGLIYVYFGVMDRTNSLNPQRWSLDGGAFLSSYYTDDYAAIQWLKQAPPGVVAEAVGGSYSDYGRAATFSGQPNVLGWPGHESQWRGGGQEMGSRQTDLETLYNTADWQTAKTILKTYNIRYVFVGSLEYGAYRVNEGKFEANLGLAYQSNATRIYDAWAILQEDNR